MAQAAPVRSPTVALGSRPAAVWLQGILGALALGIFFLFIAREIRRPFLYDEVNFTFAAEAVARTGIPFANAGYMSDRFDFGQREQWGLWHPPLYVYALGLWYKLFGVSELVGRGFGVVCTVISAFLIGYIGRRIAAPAAGAVTALIAFALFLLNPLTVQSALILDIDGTVLLLCVMLLTALYIRHVQQPARWDLAVLTVVFALALWAKMTTPLGLLSAMVGYRVIERRPWLGLREVAIVGLGGAAIFLMTYTAVFTALRMPWDLPFVTLLQEFADASESTEKWRETFESVIRTVSPAAWWISPALLVLSLAALARRVRDFIESRQPHVIDVILILALGIYTTYLIKLAGLFPKYQITALPFLCLATAWLVGRVVWPARRVDMIVWALALVSAANYYRGVPIEWFQEGFGSVDAHLLVQPLMLIVILVGLAVIIAGGPLGRHLTMVALVLVVGWSLGMGWRQSRASFSTNYWYGSHGQREAAAMLDTLVAPDEFWGGAKEVAYYARNHNYIDQDTLQYWIEHYGGLEQPISGHVPRVLAVWTGHSYVAWVFHVAISDEFERVAEVGTYTLLVRKVADEP